MLPSKAITHCSRPSEFGNYEVICDFSTAISLQKKHCIFLQNQTNFISATEWTAHIFVTDIAVSDWKEALLLFTSISCTLSLTRYSQHGMRTWSDDFDIMCRLKFWWSRNENGQQLPHSIHTKIWWWKCSNVSWRQAQSGFDGIFLAHCMVFGRGSGKTMIIWLGATRSRGGDGDAEMNMGIVVWLCAELFQTMTIRSGEICARNDNVFLAY